MGLMIMKIISLRTCIILTLCWLLTFRLSSSACAQSSNAPISQSSTHGWSLNGDGIVAHINSAGYLDSLKYKGEETVGEPFSYQPQAKLTETGVVKEPNGLLVSLSNGKDNATIEYKLIPSGIKIVTTWKGAGYAEFTFHASKALLGVELLNYKGLTKGGEATTFVENGEIRGVPAIPSSSNQMVRFLFHGFSMKAYTVAWGAPFNYESAGSIQNYHWGRPLLDANKPFSIHFIFRKSPFSAKLPAPPFVPRATVTAGLYYSNLPCKWNIDLGTPQALRYLRNAGIDSLTLHWKAFNYHDRMVAKGAGQLSLASLTPGVDIIRPIFIRLPDSGYYSLLFSLSDSKGRMLRSDFLTRCTLIHRVAGMVNRLDNLKNGSMDDYDVMAMIGIGAVRESHNIGDYFSTQQQKAPQWQPVPGTSPPIWMHVNDLDTLFSHASHQSEKYGIPYFFQANSRPSYATPSNYEAMAYALVSRYHSLCHVWEVENEPNFSYSPQNYIRQALIPFSKGAHRADPSCIVMGPACVGVKETLEFMREIYKEKANKWLDAVSTHTYPGPGESWEQFGNTTMIRELRSWMKANGDGVKEIWQTEQGYEWENSPKIQSARYTVRQFLQGARLGISPFHQYYFYPQWNGFEDWYLDGGGEAGDEHSLTLSGAALRFLAEQLNGRHYVGDVPPRLYKGIFLSRFDGGAGDVVVAWTFDFPYTLKLRIPKFEGAYNMMGEPVPVRVAPHAVYSMSISGEPIYIHLATGGEIRVLNHPFGTNLALASQGAVATASSSDAKHPPSYANDGLWQLWDKAPGLPGRTAWQSAIPNPSAKRPDWLEIRFPSPKRIDRIIALCYLPAVNASPRDYQFQILTHGKWRTVQNVRKANGWSMMSTFPPANASAIRFVISRINDGWQTNRKWMKILMGSRSTHYTDSKTLVSELEAYAH
jgi:hypothetical protein